MKTQIIRNVSVALLAAASVFAQGSQKLMVRIPFGFHMGDSILPAGQYTVDAPSHTVLRFRSEDFKSTTMILTHAVERVSSPHNPSQGRLIFNKYGDKYFLSQVWNPGSNSGRALLRTKREVEAAADLNRGTESILASK